MGCKKKKKKELQKQVVEFGALTTKKAFVWTRVSSEDQKKKNNSLETQRDLCDEYAKREGIEIVAYYGNTNESGEKARILFHGMIKDALANPEINIILVAWYDRFSREGAEGILSKELLKKEGKYVISATEPLDPDSFTGAFMEDFLLLIANVNNKDRKDKFHKGRVNCVKRGDWYNKLPLGFNRKKIDKKHIITVNETGELLRKAFMWKAYEKITDAEILKRLEAQGLKLTKQALSFIFHNPFYCGKIVHQFTDYEAVKGNQEELVSEEIFNIVNGIKTHNGYIQDRTNPVYLLNNFILCSKCGSNLHYSGYHRIKKTGAIYHYYKCNTKGCKCNRTLNFMHNKFNDVLYSYSISEELAPILAKVFIKVFNDQNKSNAELKDQVEKGLTKCKSQINDVNLKYGLGTISEEVYNITIDKLKEDKRVLEEEMKRVQNIFSNSVDFIQRSVVMCSNIGELWENSSYNMCKKIQNLVYPKGIIFDPEKEEYRTQNENKVFELMGRISSKYDEIKKTNQDKKSDLSNVVEHIGLEPITFRLPV